MTTPSYPRYVQPPTTFVALDWTSSGTAAEAQAFLDAHSIPATAILNGTSLWLLMPNSQPSSLTYVPGTTVILRNDGGGWYVDATRTNKTGLAPFSDFYVS
ncbi:hypothetical protein ACWEV3_41020 [Saccharopolyspora sp. NPDC003752]